eukprot:TRINITY_DN3517_c0_g4_i1.p2 TRINITY_DN3517_c0_g4~~TRINITY_DN3517_c0_g4_i1.p2  ORF type:complete len:137 (-),score=26.78 TRINITY_DN3517_c0_g4_i1:495-905(-)
MGCSAPGFLLSYPNMTVVFSGDQGASIPVRANNKRDDAEGSNLFLLTISPQAFPSTTRITFDPLPESVLKTFLPSSNWVQNRNISAYYFNIYSAVARFWVNQTDMSSSAVFHFSFRPTLPLKNPPSVSHFAFCLCQ